MTDIRALFGATLNEIHGLLLKHEAGLTQRFEDASALAEFSVRGLAGHLLRAMTTAETYLDRPPPAADGGVGVEPISAAMYYVTVLTADRDLDSDFNRSIRQRGVESAPDRPEGFAVEWAETAARLISRLEQEPDDRLVQVYGDHVLTLDDYLVTRLIELVVHVDDLAVSLGMELPPLPPAATDVTIATLVAVARMRHGDTAVVRALTRRERDAVEALRVI